MPISLIYQLRFTTTLYVDKRNRHSRYPHVSVHKSVPQKTNPMAHPGGIIHSVSISLALPWRTMRSGNSS